MYNFEEIKKALEPYKGSVSGVFNCIGSDPSNQFNTVYNKDGVLILHNTYYNYLDVVGLSKEHFSEVYEMSNFDWDTYMQRQQEELEELELRKEADLINKIISITAGYFIESINENELIELLMSISNNNKYVKEHILNVITDSNN
jgi:hypothetical protein